VGSGAKRLALILALAALTEGASPPHSPQPSPPQTDSPAAIQCKDRSISDEARIAACTAVIASGQSLGSPLAEIYSNRCAALISRSLGARVQKGGSKSPTARDDEDHALQDCSQAIALNPDASHAYRSRAELYGFRHDWDHAIADYDQAIRLKPNAGIYYAFRGTDYANKGDYDRAIADCSLAQSLGGMLAGFDKLCLSNAIGSKARVAAGQKLGDMRAWCWGKALIQEGWTKELAVPGCTALIESGKEKPVDLAEDYYNRGHARMYAEDVDHDKELADYSGAIRYRPRYADAYGWRGITYYVHKADYDHAIADLTMALRLKSDDRLYLSYRGQALLAKGRYALATKDFRRLIALDPSQAEAFVHLSEADIGRGDFTQAIADANQAIKLDPAGGSGTEAYNSRGNAHFHLGALGDAIADYDTALKRYPDFWEALYGRGVAKLRQGDMAGGKADIDAAAKLHPHAAEEERKRGIGP
jgi:tetratricopeptide (TPR) repeat protein